MNLQFQKQVQTETSISRVLYYTAPETRAYDTEFLGRVLLYLNAMICLH